MTVRLHEKYKKEITNTLKEKYNYIINEHPIIDFAGVLIGMTGVVSIYHLIEMKNKRDI